MTTETKSKSLGAAIDEILNALSLMEKKDQLVAINAVCAHLALEIVTPQENRSSSFNDHTPPPLSTQGSNAYGPSSKTDIRSLKEEKNPSSAREMACIVAYYLENLAPDNEKKDSITTDDITKYFKQAGYPLPSALSQLLKDSKSAGYFDSGDRGSYKLNPVGHNLVVHTLPKNGSSTSRSRSGSAKAPKGKTVKKNKSKR